MMAWRRKRRKNSHLGEVPTERIAYPLDGRINVREESMIEFVWLSDELSVEEDLRGLGGFSAEQVWTEKQGKDELFGQYIVIKWP